MRKLIALVMVLAALSAAAQYSRVSDAKMVDIRRGEMPVHHAARGIKAKSLTNDNPLPPVNVRATAGPDNTVTVSWEAPGEVGESGGHVEVSELTYYIFDAFGSYYDPAIAVTTETSYVFDYSDLTAPDFVAYQVTCGVDETYYSLDVSTGIIAVGPAQERPFVESFADAKVHNMMAIDSKSSYTVDYGTMEDNEEMASQDADGGFYRMLPSKPGDMFGFMTARISMAEAAGTVFEFFYQGAAGKIDAMVAADGGEFAVVSTIQLGAETAEDWSLCRVPLDEYYDAEYIQIEVRMRDGVPAKGVAIDNIRVRDLVACDLRIAAMTAPQKASAPADFTIGVKVENVGTEACEGAVVDLYRNGEKVESREVGALEPDAKADIAFATCVTLADAETVTYRAVIVLDGDVNAKNNEAEAAIEVTMPIYPTVTGLETTAEGEGTVTLTWQEPDLSLLSKPVRVVEGFENPDYPMFSITGFGEWTVYDGDGDRTCCPFRDVNNPYRGKAQAWQLYNPVAAGIPEENLIDCQPHSGECMAVAWASYGNNNDNWLISPELPGTAQRLTFWAMSFTAGASETITIYTSTTDAKPESFEALTSYKFIPETWTRYNVQLPEGTRYFAIVHDPYGETWMLYLDDVSYMSKPEVPMDIELVGYNVYRDGMLINDEPLATPGFTDNTTGAHSYQVSAVYNYGESRFSDPVLVDIAGIAAVSADASKAEIFTLDGRRVAGDSALHPGIYLERRGATTRKVIR